jgi:hypothetical protein
MSRTIDMHRVCDLLTERGIFAYVEHTGGNVATIFAGEVYEDEDGESRYPAIAGPGRFEGPWWSNPRGETADFYIGPDDDGEASVDCVPEDSDEVDLTNLIEAQVNRHKEIT